MSRHKREDAQQLSLGVTEQLDGLARERRIRTLVGLDGDGRTWLQQRLFEAYRAYAAFAQPEHRATEPDDASR